MNICIFYYDGFSEFEIAITALEFSSENLITAALEDRVYRSEGKLKFVPDKIIEELNPSEIDLFVIPGGDPTTLFDHPTLKKFILEMNNKGKKIAAICGGTELLAAYGILENKRCTGDGNGLRKDAAYIKMFEKSLITNEDIVVDGNIITATGQSYVEFAFKLGELMNIYKSKELMKKSYHWFKNIKD